MVGGGRRWTGSRTLGESLHRRGKERFGNRLGDSVGVSQTSIRLLGKEVVPFFVSTSKVVSFSAGNWPPNLIIKVTFPGNRCPHVDSKLAPYIIDKYTRV